MLLEFKKITAFNELNNFPLDGYETSISYRTIKKETDSKFELSIERYKRDIPFIKKWDPFSDDIERLTEIVDKGLSFGLFEDKEMVGIFVLEKYEWSNSLNIEQIEIVRKKRGLGYGGLMIKEIERIAKLEKVRLIRLETQTTNGIAIDFYKKNGFKIEGVDLSFYSNNDYDNQEIAVFMKKNVE